MKKQSASFRRVKEEDIEIKNEELANNTFEAKGVCLLDNLLFIFTSIIRLQNNDSVSIVGTETAA